MLVQVRCIEVQVHSILEQVHNMLAQASSLLRCRNRCFGQLASQTDRLVRQTLKPQSLSKQLSLQPKIDSSEPP
jgi:hypothetical protein